MVRQVGEDDGSSAVRSDHPSGRNGPALDCKPAQFAASTNAIPCYAGVQMVISEPLKLAATPGLVAVT